jgi:uncharacterized protein with von Willebrand factor type A (vWA) domain
MTEPGDRLAENVVHFVRLLRGAGLRLGPASAVDALAAAAAVNLFHKAELYWALHATLVRRAEDHDLFDQAFRLFWRDPLGADAALSLLLPRARLPARPGASRRVSEAFRPPDAPAETSRRERVEVDATLTFSPDEVLRTRDFDDMSAAELARARAAVARMQLLLRPVTTRRFHPDPRGHRIDLRRTLRASLRTLGESATLERRARRRRAPPLVVLCDISGSMGRYAEVLLTFLHTLSAARARVHTFLFATRLSNVTRTLRHRDVDEALRRCGREVVDWAGGTRLHACLAEFNRVWARRLLGQGAIVLLVTDGLDRDPDDGLADEAARLHRSCRRLIWLNPLLRYAGFEPRARGVRALLPHVDEHRPVHDLASLEELARALSGRAVSVPPGPPTTGLRLR